MKPTYLFPLGLCLLLNMAVAETTVSVTAASQAATPTVSTQDLKTLELQFQEKMLDLRKETLDSQQETIARWLTLIGLLSLILPLAFYWRERSNMLENLKQAINEAKGILTKLKNIYRKLKANTEPPLTTRHKSNKCVITSPTLIMQPHNKLPYKSQTIYKITNKSL